IENAGLDFYAVRPDVDPDDGVLLRRIMDSRRGTEIILRELLFPFIRESYADITAAAENADLLVTHPITYAGPVVAAKRRLPWISTGLSPMTFFSCYDLPVLPPAPWLVHARRFGPWMSRLLLRLMRRVTR